MMRRRIVKYIECTTQAELDRVLKECPNDRAILRGNGPFVVLGSSHVEAWGSSHVVARGSSHVVAGSFVAVHVHSDAATVSGGVVIRVKPPTSSEEWCDRYGVKVVDGVAILYKAVRDDLRSKHCFLYPLGEAVTAPDWDGGRDECGGGLHFSPCPSMAKYFDLAATRFLACPIAITDMRTPQAEDADPKKIKARCTCGPSVEVDLWGDPIKASK
jgi:hypothetical protein